MPWSSNPVDFNASTPPLPPDGPTQQPLSPERSIWLWGLVPIIFACLRLLVVSRGNPETLRALVQNLNVTALVLATILPLGATMIAWLLFVAFLGAISKGDKKKSWQTRFWLLLLPTFILIYFAMPLSHIAWNSAVFISIVVIIIGQAMSQHKKAKITAALLSAGVAAWLITVLVMPFILLLARSEMWLPKERLTVENASISPVYVLSSDERWTSYMDEHRKVHIVATEKITDRNTFDTPESLWSKTISEILTCS